MIKRRLVLLAVTVGAASALFLAPSASAAVEFGDNCIGDKPAPGEYTLTELSRSPGGLPLAAPSSGVITQLKVNFGPPVPFTIPTTVKVLRSAGGDNYTVVGQALTQVGPGGQPVTNTRLPVLAGDRLGLHGEPFTYEGTAIPGLSVYCDIEDGSVLGAATGNPGPGATATFMPAVEARVPVVGVLEPDADGDGYGDETQDKCPISAAVQVPCPLVVLDAIPIAGGNAVRVLVATSTAAPVIVSGTVKLGKGAKANLASKTKTVEAGKISSFRLAFPASLKERLKELGPKKKLTLKIAATSTNVAGQVSTDKVNAKLKGQG